MRSELDVVQEYTKLHAARVEYPDHFSAEDERRLLELRAIYEELLGSRALSKVPPAERFSREEILEKIPARDRLRIPAMLPVFFCHGDTYAPATSSNLSTGGAFLASGLAPAPGATMTLYMPNLGSGYERLFETDVEVVWTAPPRGLGIRFHGADAARSRQLDDFILRFLRERLSRSSTVADGTAWVQKRGTSV